jgi:KUP system potassium uptake protein
MEAAYGLAITITMIMTTMLLSYYLYKAGADFRLTIMFLFIFLCIESSFLIANLNKFKHGGWFTLLLASLYFLIMFGWYFGRKIKNRHITFSNLSDYIEVFKDLRNDKTVSKYSTNLVYLIKANRQDQVESKVIHSIFTKQPKRAETYWFLHIDRVDEPNRFEYEINQIIPGILIRVDFHLGFKVDQKINRYFREVLDDMVKAGEFKLESSYDSLRKHGFPGDFRFILIERILLRDFELTNTENFILTLQRLIRHISIPDLIALQLDSATTEVEKVPILIKQRVNKRITPIRS